MTRLARVVALGVPHHVTQRGNARRFILDGDANRRVYLDLLRQSIEVHSLTLTGYCLMSNHIHLIVTPAKPDSLARALKDTHGRYAAYWNATNRSSGHVWQGRFYSCPLDEAHLWEALRYTELIPVHAGLVPKPRSGYGPARAHIAVPSEQTTISGWSRGRLDGRYANGEPFSPRKKLNPS